MCKSVTFYIFPILLDSLNSKKKIAIIDSNMSSQLSLILHFDFDFQSQNFSILFGKYDMQILLIALAHPACCVCVVYVCVYVRLSH